MGWSGGTDIACALIETLKENVPDDKARFWIYRRMIEAMEDGDWDTQDEAKGRDFAFDAALDDLHPEREDDES